MKIIYTSLLALFLASCGGEQVQENASDASGVVKMKNDTKASKEQIKQVAEVETIAAVTETVNSNEASLETNRTDEKAMVETSASISEEITNTEKLEPVKEPMVAKEDVTITEPEMIETPPSAEAVVAVASKIDHLAWDVLVRKYVGSNGKVNYKGFKSSLAALNSYTGELSKEIPGSNWTKNEKLAYWINAYNAFTVKLIVDNYPLKSITDIPKAWDNKNIKIAGKMYSLGGIENEILRKMNEPRIHFAINCASVSCPNLLNRAFLADKMSSQLRKVTKSFFTDATKNNFEGKTIRISKLFDWYGTDFAKGDVLKYINANRTDQLSDKTKIAYLEYDWSLNE